MASSSFEITVTLPADGRYAETARELAVHAARQAGLSELRAGAFGDEVAAAVRPSLEASREDVPVVVRRVGGPVEVVVNGRTLTADPEPES